MIKTITRIFIGITSLTLVPLLWHGIAPMSLCWLQAEQLAICVVGSFLSAIIAGILAIESY